MNYKEKRLERRLCERERELIVAERDRAWLTERWRLATACTRDLDQIVADLMRCKTDTERRVRAP